MNFEKKSQEPKTEVSKNPIVDIEVEEGAKINGNITAFFVKIENPEFESIIKVLGDDEALQFNTEHMSHDGGDTVKVAKEKAELLSEELLKPEVQAEIYELYEELEAIDEQRGEVLQKYNNLMNK